MDDHPSLDYAGPRGGPVLRISRRIVLQTASAAAAATLIAATAIALVIDDPRAATTAARASGTRTMDGASLAAPGSREEAGESRDGESRDSREAKDGDAPTDREDPRVVRDDADRSPRRARFGLRAPGPAAMAGTSDQDARTVKPDARTAPATSSAPGSTTTTTTTTSDDKKTPDLPPGVGLRGEYWDLDHQIANLPPMNGGDAQLVRIDPTIAFAADGWNLPFRELETWATCWRGYFRATSAGVYTFVLGSDDGALLDIDNVAVCGRDRLQSYTESTGKIELAVGLHPLRVRYFNNLGPGIAILKFVPPDGGDPAVVPQELLYPPSGDVERSRPVVRGASPALAHPLDTIVLSGSGFSAVPGENAVTFGPEHAPATVTRSSETELAIIVPEGVDSGPIAVTVAGQTSPGIDYQVGGPFGLWARYWHSTSDVLDFASPPALPDDQRLVGPVDLHGGGFGLPFSERFGGRLEGRIYARDAGEHQVAIDSDDGGRLFVDGQMVASAPGLHPSQRAQAKVILTVGWHEVAIDYFQNRGAADLVLLLAPPDGTLAVCPRGRLAPPEWLSRIQTPIISDVSPRPAKVADRVRISGSSLAASGIDTNVLVGGLPLKVLASTESAILAEVPEGVTSGPLVVRLGPLASAPVQLDITGYGLTAEYWHFPGPIGSLPSFATPADFARTDNAVDFEEDAAFKLPFEPDHFAARWRADLLAPVDGLYQLTVGADDGQRLLIDGKVVLEDDTLHPYTEVSGTIQLTAGPHALELQFFQNEGAARCRLFWVVPGSGRALVPTSAVVPR
jgi:hypothetical protein